MGDLGFQRLVFQDSLALYASTEAVSGDPERSRLFYFAFLAGGAQAPASFDLPQCFKDDAGVQRGAFVFVDGQPPAPAALFAELKSALQVSPTDGSYPRIAWRDASAGYQNQVVLSVAGAVPVGNQLPFGRWIVAVNKGSAVVQGDGDQLTIKKSPESGVNSLQVQVVQSDGTQEQAGTPLDAIGVPLSGAHTGGMLFDWQWVHRQLGDEFGGELRMFYGKDNTSANAVRYPLFVPPPDPGPRQKPNLAFKVTAHPQAPLNGYRTRLALAPNPPSGFNQLSSILMRTPTGSQVSLQAQATGDTGSGAGFGFAKTAGASGVDLYLTPVGNFSVQPAASQKPGVQVMAGISGSEFVLTEPGDLLTFENNRSAFAAGFRPGGGQVPLTSDFTTSWVKVHKNGAQAPADDKVVTTSYCAQPSSATYFGRHKDQPADAFPVAIGISLSQLATLPEDENPFFPFMPYGGIFYEDADKGIDNPNPNVQASDVGALERQAVEPSRRKLLQPTFDKKYGPIFFDAANNRAFEGGFARTPLGFVAELNQSGENGAPAGSWKTLRLAQSPQNPDQYLQLTANANGVVNPTFSNAVLSDNLFMVVTDPELMWPSGNAVRDNEIQLGDFTFKVDVGPLDESTDADHPKALVIFKFMPGVSTADLVNQTDRWTSFLAGGDAAKVREQINGYIEAAEGGGDLFADFLRLVNDPDWTGMLVFNCPLDYQALPLDLQILLGGIDGTLRAHHFGVTVNRVKDEATGTMSITKSSLFAVIDYHKDFVAPSDFPAFQVLLLNVEYANSKLVVFNSTIAFSLDTLFGNPAELTVAPDSDHKETGTIVIAGVYTLHTDGTGSLVFSTTDQRAFSFPADDSNLRVLEAQSVNDATLVPVRRQPLDGGGIKAVSAFRLDGKLAFKDDIGGDLFSYGEVTDDVPDKGLAITGYAHEMTTDIPTDGPATIEQPIRTDLSGLKVDATQSASRAKSFEQTFPSSIDSMRFVEGGLGTSQTGAWAVKNDDLDTSVEPTYMLRFKIPMGNLGGLVSSTNNITSDFYLGWVPGGDKDTADTVGAVLVLPAVVAGPNGFNIQGIASSSFEYVELDRQEFKPSHGDGDSEFAYYLRFVHFASSLLSLPLFYSNGPKDLGMFGSPSDPGGDNVMWFVGKSEDTDAWDKGPQLSITVLDDLPTVFIGRAFKIETDPTDPNVIDDAIESLNLLKDLMVKEFMAYMYANAGKYSSAAGMAFALKFSFKSLDLSVLLHDNDFYGAQIKLDLSDDDEDGDGEGGDGEGGDGEKKGTEVARKDDGKEDDDKKGIKKLDGFEFMIIYRKISEHLGVWSAEIFVDVGQIELGAAELTLPNFSISIWTNGDWRFAIGWPIDNHPITVQFQAGPVPVIAKAGFYLAKLRSADAPDAFGDDFKLIWAFGLGLSAGVGKEWEKGPFSASATLTLGLTVQGFLASHSGNITQDGVDYHWWGISLSLVGAVEGSVDFKIISASLSITLTLTLSLAIETKHSTALTLTFEATVEASVKILFVRIHFSFSTTLTLLTHNFGSGPAASITGPNPSEVSAPALAAMDMRGEMFAAPSPVAGDAVESLGARLEQVAFARHESFTAEAASADHLESLGAARVSIPMGFMLQSTSVSADGTSWQPQGVASLLIENSGEASPFFQLSKGLAQWLLATYGGAGSFEQQLQNVEAALQAHEFDGQVETCLQSQFTFTMTAMGSPTQETPFVVVPVHDSLAFRYNGKTTPFGSPTVPSNYGDIVTSYFSQNGRPAAAATTGDSVASLLFDEYFVMYAKQLVTDLQKDDVVKTGSLDAAMKVVDLDNVGGFVSRFLMGGIRLPRPDNSQSLAPMYVLTNQQFALAQNSDKTWVLGAELVGTNGTPDWITFDGAVSAALDGKQVFTSGPGSAPPWSLGPIRPLSRVPAQFPMNSSVTWTDSASRKHLLFNFSEGLHAAIERWRDSAGGGSQGPWLSLNQVTGSTQSQTSAKPYVASAALLLPLTLKTIPKPGGKPGEVLEDIYSLVGTDEVHRAYLQALLEDNSATISSLDVMVSQSRGNYESTQKPPDVLVRTNLSTSTAPGGGVLAARAVREANENNDDPYCANYAKPGKGGAELAKFLRLVWECSIVHTGGFYLQLGGLSASLFEQGQASVQLLIQTGASSSIPEAEPYHNALVGPPPDDKYAVVATLASDAQGAPVWTYSNSYAGGSVGWSIEWQDAPTTIDPLNNAGFLQGLYQMVSYQVTAVDNVPVVRNWSRPVTALSQPPDDSGHPIWSYQSAFATAPLVSGSQNIYAAVGKTISVRISIEDIFGNTLPSKFLPTLPLPVVYNDDIMGLATWGGVRTDYEVGAAGGQLQLSVNFRFDTSVVQDSSGKVDPQRLSRTLENFGKIWNQLGDPNMGAAVDTNSILAAQPLGTDAAGRAVVKDLQDYVSQIVGWLKNGGTGAGPADMAVSLPLDKSYPTKWSGDLRELQVSLVLARAHVDDSVAALAPQVRSLSSAITAAQGPSTKTDPTGLSIFASNLEAAYYKYDGSDDGIIKVATGVNSNLKSSRLGMSSVWLMRWGAKSGVTVAVLNDDANKPVFYAPPPLSTQLITRAVDGLRQYDATLGFTEVRQVFSSVDIDRWAASFLSSVENIFSPQIAPQVADRSSSDAELYDPYVANKTSLAGNISATLAYIYAYKQAVGDPDSAKFAMYQALLETLENDYDISTLVQMAALIGLHGDIEPGGAPDSPPNLYGNIRAAGSPADSEQPLPYNFSPSKLPLKDGKAWLNFLLSVEDPAAQNALTLDLDYQMGFVEHNIDPAARRCNYTPSNWLTFVLQQNAEPLPQKEKNTLTAPMGDVRMPIPLRSYPPLPKLLAAGATQDTPGADIKAIDEALSWTYTLTVELPAASQDTLNLMVTFNEPPQGHSASRPRMMLAEAAKRPPPADLFEALARYAFEYPQLAPDIKALADGGTPRSNEALKDFSELVSGVAAAWPGWVPPATNFLPVADDDTTHEQWDYAIDHTSDGTLTASASRSRGSVVWPDIEGYDAPQVETSGNRATYKLKVPGPAPARLELSWGRLYVLDYQSARTSAFIERNRNLGGAGETTNEQFVYRTETVALPAPVVPLIIAPNTLSLASGSSLEATVTAMYRALHASPGGTITSGDSQNELKLEGPISYSFRLLDNLDSSVLSFLPLFLLQEDIAPGADADAALRAAQNMNDWRKETDPKIDNSAVSFRLTIFATKIVQGEEQLPLVQFADLSITVPDNNPGWWQPSK